MALMFPGSWLEQPTNATVNLGHHVTCFNQKRVLEMTLTMWLIPGLILKRGLAFSTSVFLREILSHPYMKSILLQRLHGKAMWWGMLCVSMERGEMDSHCSSWDSLPSHSPAKTLDTGPLHLRHSHLLEISKGCRHSPFTWSRGMTDCVLSVCRTERENVGSSHQTLEWFVM